MSLIVGTPAPHFSLPDQTGQLHSLATYNGQWLLLYFYPKDDTEGCTAEACGIRDNWAGFREAGIQVVGVSPDTKGSHSRFAQKYDLPFPLLSDPKREAITAYEALNPKIMFGKPAMGTKRISYLINPEGKIAKIYPDVQPEQHAEEVLRDFDSMVV